jgi:hypothetical protein
MLLKCCENTAVKLFEVIQILIPSAFFQSQEQTLIFNFAFLL